ncbi:tetratricopeptide repeat protein [Lewinella sp. IMCC34183]|uniref:tetratricopeptide repeat protein n=1 Tax=Lewinella sp. IMCC34183 TaxID=2248762 RepID=UPI000E256A11|nr:hypothetical protein [Lewinella sp. IMCC34183]
MPNEEQQDRIDAYLSGRLADPSAFERELEADPQLRSEMEATRLALQAVEVTEHFNLKDRLRKLEAGLAPPQATPEPAAAPEAPSARVVPLNPRSRSRRWLPYAAAALLLFLAGYFFLRPVPDVPAAYAFSDVAPMDNIAYSVTKSGTGDPRAAAYAAYESGDYAAAARAFEALPEEQETDRFYLAQSLYGQGRYAEAAERFAELSMIAGFKLADEAEYYQAVSELNAGRPADGTAMLRRIANLPDHAMQADAARLLENR